MKGNKVFRIFMLIYFIIQLPIVLITILDEINHVIPINEINNSASIKNGSVGNELSIILMIWVLCPVVCLLLWAFYGRDEKLGVPVVVRPPDWMSPADAGYLIDGYIQDKDMIALLFYWASKGYVAIEEMNDDYKFIKLAPLPSGCRQFEFTMFEGLFQYSDSIWASNFNSFFLNAVKQARGLLQKDYQENEWTRLYTKSSLICEQVSKILYILPFASFMFFNVSIESSILKALVGTVVGVLFLVYALSFIRNFLVNFGCYDWIEYVKQTLIFVALLISFFWLLGRLGIGTITNTGGYLVYGTYLSKALLLQLSLLSTAICFFFSFVMRKKEHEMNRWYYEILGFKEFIQTAEKDRIKMLVEEEPAYFMDILPFAYVLGVSKEWIGQFDTVLLNNEDLTDIDTCCASVMFQSMDSVADKIPKSSFAFRRGSSSGSWFSDGGGGGS